MFVSNISYFINALIMSPDLFMSNENKITHENAFQTFKNLLISLNSRHKKNLVRNGFSLLKNFLAFFLMVFCQRV